MEFCGKDNMSIFLIIVSYDIFINKAGKSLLYSYGRKITDESTRALSYICSFQLIPKISAVEVL